MDKTKTEIVELYNDKLSFFEIFFSSLFYTFSLVAFLSFFYFLFNSGFSYEVFKASPAFLTLTFVFLNPAIIISEVNIIRVSTSEKKIFHTIEILFYKKNKVIEAEFFEYVAINKSNLGYNVTLWYEGNRRMELVSFYKKEKVFNYAKAVAKGIKTDLLDKTDLENPIWTASKDL